MKKLLVVAFVALLCACASGGKSDMANLDAVIQQASAEINDALPAGTKVALLNFNSGSDVFSDYVLEEMSIALVKERKLTVVDRKEIDLIRGEMNFQMSGDVSDESAQEIGVMLGAQFIVSGSLVNMGDTYRFRTKAINVASAAIQTSSSISVKDDPQMRHLLGQSGGPSTSSGTGNAPKASGAQSSTQSPPAQQTQPAAPAEPALPAYKIGDTGPAGGLIFYDKGTNTGGWRYLEAAPEDLNRQLYAVSEAINLKDCSERAVGRGKTNTAAIMREAANKGGGFGWAAQACDAFTLNGFNDWFLPSQDELHYMYGNLHMQGLGDFRNDDYWTSTSNINYGISISTLFMYERFSDGDTRSESGARYQMRIRPIRQVPGPTGTARN